MDAGFMFRRGRVAALLVMLALLGACKKEGRLADARGDGGTNLLLITLDTTRADRIGAYGDTRAATPTIDRLAREGVRFERAYTAAPLTLPAHVTLMTGREPQAHQVRNNGTYSLRPEETTLAEIFRQAGFSTMAMIAAYVLEKKFGLDQGFAVYDDELNASGEATTFRSEITADRVYDKFSRWLERAPASPFFCWVHLYDPHHPYEPPASFRDRFPDDPYRGEIAYMDETIGRMLRDLESRGLLKNTLVVVAGDHGEGFGEHGESGHGVFCYEETLRVPLIFHQPRLFRGGRVVTQPVGLVDVLPTLLELYRLPRPAGVQGRSVAQLLNRDENPAKPVPALYFESLYGMEEMGWAPLSGLVRGPLKYISLPRAELYDLAADPREKDNLYLKKNVQAKGLARDLDSYLEKTVSAGQAALRPRQSRLDQDRLRALGYLAAGGPALRAESSADPKDGIGTMNLLLEARQAIHSGDLDGAERQIAALRATGIDRTLPQFHDMRYELALARKEPCGHRGGPARGHCPLPRHFPLCPAAGGVFSRPGRCAADRGNGAACPGARSPGRGSPLAAGRALPRPEADRQGHRPFPAGLGAGARRSQAGDRAGRHEHRNGTSRAGPGRAAQVDPGRPGFRLAAASGDPRPGLQAAGQARPAANWRKACSRTWCASSAATRPTGPSWASPSSIAARGTRPSSRSSRPCGSTPSRHWP